MWDWEEMASRVAYDLASFPRETPPAPWCNLSHFTQLNTGKR